MALPEDVAARFAYHPPGGPSTRDGICSYDTIAAHDQIRKTVAATAESLVAILPPEAGRYAALVLTSLEETMHWANAGVAIHGGPDDQWAEERRHRAE